MKLKPGLVFLIPAVLCGVVAAQEYEGPTVLSRSGGGIRPYGERVGEDSKFRAYGLAEAIYDYGFLPVSTTATGGTTSLGGLFGFQGNLGINGTKRWRRTSLGLDYTGSYRSYTKKTYFNGADNFLGLEFGEQANRRTLITGTVTAGTSSRVFSFANNLIGVPLGNILPTTDIFDGRTYFLNGGMGLSHQLSSRLGFELRAEGFRVERHSTSLVSVQGYTPKASLSYRLNRRQTVGAIYNFIHYDYPRAFGETNIHVAMGFWGYDINQRWKFEAQGGIFAANAAGTRTVAADPVVQQLLGVTTISEAFSRIVTLPNAQLRLTGKTRNSSFAVTLYRGSGAGNGVTLSSSETSGAVYYNYVFSKNFSASAHGNYSSSVGLSNSAERYGIYSAGTDVTYNTAGSLFYSFRGLYRRSSISTINLLGQDSFQIGLGIGWSVRDVPFIH